MQKTKQTNKIKTGSVCKDFSVTASSPGAAKYLWYFDCVTVTNLLSFLLLRSRKNAGKYKQILRNMVICGNVIYKSYHILLTNVNQCNFYELMLD